MKKDIHPAYEDMNVTCSCGHKFTTRSAFGRDLLIETCSQCHPAYTGKHKATNTAGPIDKFRNRYGIKKSADAVEKSDAEAA
jgi:large subunit ribosomal protein L31